MKTTKVIAVALAIFGAAGPAAAEHPDFSGTWKAVVRRVGRDTCRAKSRRKLNLTIILWNTSENRSYGEISGSGESIQGTGPRLSRAFSVWNVENWTSEKYGLCNTQEGIYVPSINLAKMT